MKEGHVLLVEDELNFGSVLEQFLKMNDFRVTWVKNGAEAWSVIKSEKTFDCCVLDVMMPEMDGFTLGREISKSRPALPFIYLTARSLKEDVIRGYLAGAWDYVTKPFDSEILVYKIRAVLQRQAPPPPVPAMLSIGRFVFDRDLRTLSCNGHERKLSPKEGKLLQVLAFNLNKVVSRETIINAVWEDDNYFTRRSMDVYMSKLRKYLQDDPEVSIISVHAGGYQLCVRTAGATG